MYSGELCHLGDICYPHRMKRAITIIIVLLLGFGMVATFSLPGIGGGF